MGSKEAKSAAQEKERKMPIMASCLSFQQSKALDENEEKFSKYQVFSSKKKKLLQKRKKKKKMKRKEDDAKCNLVAKVEFQG